MRSVLLAGSAAESVKSMKLTSTVPRCILIVGEEDTLSNK